MSEYYREEEEEEEQQQLEAFDEYLKKKKKDHFLTRILQLVFSVSIFSLVLCYSSAGLSLFPHSFNVYFSTFLFSFFTHTLERKYMFLICNGILAFLAKSSSPSSTTSSSSSSDYLAAAAAAAHYQLSASDLPAEINEQVCLEDVEISTSSSASACCVAADHHKINGGDVRVENVESFAKISLQAEKEEKEEERELAAEEETTQAKQKGHVEDIEDEESVIAQEEEEEEEEEDNYTGEAEAEAEDNYTREAEAEAVALNEPSTDELNKKIEEFIRKMKEEIRIEAQRPLVAV